MIAIVDPRQADAVLVGDGHAPVVAVLLTAVKNFVIPLMTESRAGDLGSVEGSIPRRYLRKSMRGTS